MTHFAHLALDAGSRVGQGLALGHMAVQTFGQEIRRQRRAAANSVAELAIRLEEAREDEAVAMHRAALAEQAAAQARRAAANLVVENHAMAQEIMALRAELAAARGYAA
ncbi:hypothetical protein NS228_23820 [Methylobacterium indicum]|uniref:hypothetical protein n=1 Tax=Methylobacterium indicum TaxID=1775910 RepID=UPI000733F937|nr:hypothetical protein [Methylobacterium indicum]KTS25893.1 hypothetical protein NS229_18865 [Methylobacterium indicum]KTS30702.1 hypothetical protein NS228_23820 [Methylobacterium indicum]KTS52514.1 hypothetical protein NS230_09455 [Methylobacterium indicum]